MNWVDGCALFLVGLPAVSGIRNGLLSGLIKLAWIAAVPALAFWQMDGLQAWTKGRIDLPSLALPTLLLLAAVVVGWVLGAINVWIWRKLSEDSSLAWTDRLLGALVGAAKGALLSSALLITVPLLWKSAAPDFQSSWSVRHALAPVQSPARDWIQRHLGLSAP